MFLSHSTTLCRFPLAVVLSAAMIYGCSSGNGGGGGGGGGNIDAGQSPDTGGGGPDLGPTPPTGTIAGTVYDAVAIAPLQGALVRAGGQSTTTNANGKFNLTVSPGSDVAVSVQHQDFAGSLRIIDVVDNQTSGTEFFLAQIGSQIQVNNAENGGTATGNDGASITFPASALANPDGTLVTGDVDISITPIDVTDPDELRAFPGQFIGTRDDGTEVLIETVVPMDITAMQGSTVLNLATGTEVEITFPVTDPNAPATVELWSLDPETGVWQEEGIGIRTLDSNGNPIYRATISHLSWWNLDKPIETRTCIRGCVTKDGNPVSGAGVDTTAVDYNFSNQAQTDATGCFAMDVKRNGQIMVQAKQGQDASPTVVVIAQDVAMSVDANPITDCQDLGDFALAPPDPANTDCPAGLVKCNGKCVNTARHTQHCGDCNQPCNNVPSCVDGTCQCPNSQTDCSGSCVDTQVDRNHCGGCVQPCPDEQECVASQCENIVCPAGSGLELCTNDCVDKQTSNVHCGGCDQQCGPYAGPGGGIGGGGTTEPTSGFFPLVGENTTNPQCVAGTCVCPSGLGKCGTNDAEAFCVDHNTHRDYCGNCNTQCPVGEYCHIGTCEPIVCDPALTLCGNDCVDAQTNNAHCGGCDQPCGPGGDFELSYFLLAGDGSVGGGTAGGTQNVTCIDGVCQCPAGLTECSNGDFPICVDTDTNSQHCGGCDNLCPQGEECVGGNCQAIACDPGLTLCGNDCVDTQTNNAHCGACDGVCDGEGEGGANCQAGQCVCPQGMVRCPQGPGGGAFCLPDGSICPSAVLADMAGVWRVDYTGLGNPNSVEIWHGHPDCGVLIGDLTDNTRDPLTWHRQWAERTIEVLEQDNDGITGFKQTICHTTGTQPPGLAGAGTCTALAFYRFDFTVTGCDRWAGMGLLGCWVAVEADDPRPAAEEIDTKVLLLQCSADWTDTAACGQAYAQPRQVFGTDPAEFFATIEAELQCPQGAEPQDFAAMQGAWLVDLTVTQADRFDLWHVPGTCGEFMVDSTSGPELYWRFWLETLEMTVTARDNQNNVTAWKHAVRHTANSKPAGVAQAGNSTGNRFYMFDFTTPGCDRWAGTSMLSCGAMVGQFDPRPLPSEVAQLPLFLHCGLDATDDTACGAQFAEPRPVANADPPENQAPIADDLPQCAQDAGGGGGTEQ